MKNHTVLIAVVIIFLAVFFTWGTKAQPWVLVLSGAFILGWVLMGGQSMFAQLKAAKL
jgi:sugar phosphate permease